MSRVDAEVCKISSNVHGRIRIFIFAEFQECWQSRCQGNRTLRNSEKSAEVTQTNSNKSLENMCSNGDHLKFPSGNITMAAWVTETMQIGLNGIFRSFSTITDLLLHCRHGLLALLQRVLVCLQRFRLGSSWHHFSTSNILIILSRTESRTRKRVLLMFEANHKVRTQSTLILSK